jgi:xanthine/uracil/vitamin C permease (AzgA family)
MALFTENFRTAGICALLALLGTLFTAILHVKDVKGSILYGILATWLVGIVCEWTGLYLPNAQEGYYSLIPTLAMTDFSALGKTFGQCFKADFNGVGIFNFIVYILDILQVVKRLEYHIFLQEEESAYERNYSCAKIRKLFKKSHFLKSTPLFIFYCIIQQWRDFFNSFFISVNKFKKNQKKIAKNWV